MNNNAINRKSNEKKNLKNSNLDIKTFKTFGIKQNIQMKKNQKEESNFIYTNNFSEQLINTLIKGKKNLSFSDEKELYLINHDKIRQKSSKRIYDNFVKNFASFHHLNIDDYNINKLLLIKKPQRKKKERNNISLFLTRGNILWNSTIIKNHPQCTRYQLPLYNHNVNKTSLFSPRKVDINSYRSKITENGLKNKNNKLQINNNKNKINNSIKYEQRHKDAKPFSSFFLNNK